MKISFFFRHKNKDRHSIEVQFENIQNKLPETTKYTNYNSKFQSKNIFKILLNIFEAIFRQSEINHITGDIHYISFLLKKSKTILTIHDIESSCKTNKLKSFFIKLLWFTIPAKSVKYITVISEFTKNQLLNYVNINPEKIHIIPDCIADIYTHSPKEFNIKKPVLLQVGTKTNKNIPRLIEAIKDINCKLIIIGKLTEKQQTLLKKNKINYENKYNLSHTELLNYYNKADILTFISTYEGFGVPIIEANAVGRPVITSNISPMSEVSDDAAVLVNPYNIKEIKEAILEVINNEKLRKSLINKGLKNAKKYKSKHISRQYYELYKKILKK